MGESLLSHVVVPIASESDATATCAALESVVDENTERITVVHVVERTRGYPDRATFEAREEAAERLFSIVEEWFRAGPEVRHELRYGTDPIDEIIAAAESVGATAIGFTPRPSGRLKRLLSKTDSYRLVTESEQPVVAFSRVESDGSDDADG